MLLPVFDLAFGNVTLIVMFGVAFASICLSLDQNSAAAGARVVDGLLRDLITGNHVIAVDYVAGNSECGSFFCEVSNRCLQIRGCRVRIVVIFGNHNQRQTLHGGEVHPFIKCASARAAISDVGQADDVLLLHAGAEQNSSHHRNHVAQMRNWADESSVHITEVNVEIFAT